jgi:hypothetical protein
MDKAYTPIKGMTAVEIALANYAAGCYGTPDAQRRGALHRAAFWDGFNGSPKKHVRGSICDAHAKAGKISAKGAKK